MRIVLIRNGTFFLAIAGVLDKWRVTEKPRQFQTMVDVDPNTNFVRDGNVWTSTGVTVGMDLALAVIEADFEPKTALAVARRHAVFRTRPGERAQFAVGQRKHKATRDPRLSMPIQRIHADPQADWSSVTITREGGISLRSIHRLFHDELNTGPAEFVEQLRVDLARRALLENKDLIESIIRSGGLGSLRRMDCAFVWAILTTLSE